MALPVEVVSVLSKTSNRELAVVRHTPSGKLYVRKWIHGKVGEEDALAAVERAWLDGRIITKAQRERIVMVGPEPWMHIGSPSPEWGMGTACFLMEKLERSLDDKEWLKAQPPSATVAGWCADIVAALWTLHSTTGVAHNDVAPANIGLRADGRAVLMGFHRARHFVFGDGGSTKARVCPGFADLLNCGSRPYAARALFGGYVRQHPCDDLESLVYAMTELLTPGHVLPWTDAAAAGVDAGDSEHDSLQQPLPPSKAAFVPPAGAKWLSQVLKVIDGAQACRTSAPVSFRDPGLPLEQGLMVELYAEAHDICLKAMREHGDAAGAAARSGDRPTKPARYRIPARCNWAEHLADPKRELVWLDLYGDGQGSGSAQQKEKEKGKAGSSNRSGSNRSGSNRSGSGEGDGGQSRSVACAGGGAGGGAGAAAGVARTAALSDSGSGGESSVTYASDGGSHSALSDSNSDSESTPGGSSSEATSVVFAQLGALRLRSRSARAR